MPLHTNIVTGRFDKYYQSFCSAYPTPEERYARAYAIAAGLELTGYDLEVMNRNYIAIHWGDSEDGSRRAADFGFGLTKAMRFSYEEPVMVFRNGDPDEIVAERDSYAEIDIDFGVISVAKVVHAYTGNTTERGASRMQVRPPYLGFGLLLPVKNMMNISGDLTKREVDITRPDRPPQLIASLGTVTLKKSPVEYWKVVTQEYKDEDAGTITVVKEKGRSIIERHVVVGASACQTVLEMLKYKTTKSTDKNKRLLGRMAY